MIGSINPRAILFRTVNAKIDVPLPDAPLQRTIVPGNCHFHLDTLSVRITSAPAVGVITSFFDDLATGRYGSVVRAKALVNTTEGSYRLDCTYGIVDVARFEKDITDSRLVVIGKGLDKESLSKSMASCSETLPSIIEEGKEL